MLFLLTSYFFLLGFKFRIHYVLILILFPFMTHVFGNFYFICVYMIACARIIFVCRLFLNWFLFNWILMINFWLILKVPASFSIVFSSWMIGPIRQFFFHVSFSGFCDLLSSLFNDLPLNSFDIKRLIMFKFFWIALYNWVIELTSSVW